MALKIRLVIFNPTGSEYIFSRLVGKSVMPICNPVYDETVNADQIESAEKAAKDWCRSQGITNVTNLTL